MILIFSLAILLFFGLLGNELFKLMRLPGLLGMLIAGILIGPHMFDLLDESLMAISYDLRMVALVIILLRAGLGLNRKRISAVGRPALLLAVIPLMMEGLAIALLSMWLLGFSFVQGGILGFIIAAVSPAVIVPSMVKFIEKRVGMDKNIPVMILSAASLDDVIAITVFSTFLGVYLGTALNFGMYVIGIPLAIVLGIILGLLSGFSLLFVFTRFHLRDSKKVVLILAISLFLVSLERALSDLIMIASLLGVMTIGVVMIERRKALGERLSIKLGKIWVFAKIFLFVLVGAEVNVNTAISAGVIGLIIISVGIIIRTAGVYLATIKASLNARERLFVAVSFWPKATVQAAIGSVPLSLGVAGGELILALSVLSIVVTAPLGSVMIPLISRRALHHERPL